MSTQKSSNLPNIAKQCKSPTSVQSDKSSIKSSPLSLSYADLHQSPSTSPKSRRRQARLSIFPAPTNKRDSISSEKRDSISSLPFSSEKRDSTFTLPMSSEKRDSISSLPFSSERRDSLSFSSSVNF